MIPFKVIRIKRALEDIPFGSLIVREKDDVKSESSEAKRPKSILYSLVDFHSKKDTSNFYSENKFSSISDEPSELSKNPSPGDFAVVLVPPTKSENNLNDRKIKALVEVSFDHKLPSSESHFIWDYYVCRPDWTGFISEEHILTAQTAVYNYGNSEDSIFAYNSDDNGDPSDSEDSNAEDYYRNEYPDEDEESDNDDSNERLQYRYNQRSFNTNSDSDEETDSEDGFGESDYESFSDDQYFSEDDELDDDFKRLQVDEDPHSDYIQRRNAAIKMMQKFDR